MNKNKIQNQYAIWDGSCKKLKSDLDSVPWTSPVLCKDDQPGYKLLAKGKDSLSDAETLCMLLGGHSTCTSSLDLAKRILHNANNSLAEVSKMDIVDLTRIKGIGQSKALSVIAAFELGRRRNLSEVLSKHKIACSKDASDILSSSMGDKPYEEFWIILLNKANRVIKCCCISEGGVSGTVVDPKKIFKISLDHYASSLILGHNHPSGNIHPSDADKKITLKVKEAGNMLDIAVLDHIILGEGNYYSFADSGDI
jgi:DNA repair protein RadC